MSLARITEPFRVARVDYDQVSADAAFAGLRIAPEIKGPGLSQGDAVQCATQLAILRSAVTNAGRGPVAVFNRRNELVRVVRFVRDRRAMADRLVQSGERVIFIVGGTIATPIRVDPGPGLPSNWPTVLALALDRQCRVIAGAEMGPNVPVGFAELREALLPGVPVVLMVAGAALSVIGAVAAWRFLDPDARREMLEVREASEHYSKRLEILERTGTMPPPSDTELATANRAERAASETSGGNWGLGLGIAGGFTGGTFIAGTLRS